MKMQPTIADDTTADREQLAHTWRVFQLRRPEIPGSLAEIPVLETELAGPVCRTADRASLGRIR
jgi:hypothetical protein